MKIYKLICINCGKEVADVEGKIDGITTWFSVCSECLFNVKGWTREEINKAEIYKRSKMNENFTQRIWSAEQIAHSILNFAYDNRVCEWYDEEGLVHGIYDSALDIDWLKYLFKTEEFRK